LGCTHAAIVYFVPIYCFHTGGGIFFEDGLTGGLWTMSLSSFTAIIFIVDIKLLLESRAMLTLQLAVVILTSIGLYIAWMWVSNSIIVDI
jgi:phospholipid-transporting ATPase